MFPGAFPNSARTMGWTRLPSDTIFRFHQVPVSVFSPKKSFPELPRSGTEDSGNKSPCEPEPTIVFTASDFAQVLPWRKSRRAGFALPLPVPPTTRPLCPVIGRRLSFGSDSEAGAGFTAMMYSVLGTLSLNGIDPLRWLEAWLTACAENGGRPPGDLSAWLPWSMNPERRRALMAPG